MTDSATAIATDQQTVIDVLSSPATHGGVPVERIDTHTSIVFLAGDRAFKLKRAVKYDYLDVSTIDRRQRFCEAELRINRRSAPTLYRRIVPITEAADGSLSLGGNGVPVDWVVEMNRFDQDALFDRLAARGALDLALMSPLADAVAQFHGSAERRRDHGGKKGMAWVVRGNADGFAQFGAGVLHPAAYLRVTQKSLAEIERHGALLELRRAGGLVRQCHGDLHLRNIVLLDGAPTLFDAIEFNDEIACTDVLYDLAFLLMDLWKRNLPKHANVVWNRYLLQTGDHSGVCLLPLFLSCRAAVRAKTSATAARLQTDSKRKTELEDLSRAYLAMAEELLRPRSPRIIAIGGFSGSVKSTLAAALAPSIGEIPGAIVLRSDEIRKGLFGVSPFERLGPEGYTSEVSKRVYGALAHEATALVHAGHAVIVDAVYARSADRQEIERAATEASVPFIGLWLDASEDVLVARTEQRHGDASDATADVVRLQLRVGAGPMQWQRIDASEQMDVVRERAAAVACSR